MAKRKSITERMKIDALLWLALVADRPVICAWCMVSITPIDKIEWDHIQPVSAGGADIYSNLRPLHFACHKAKTFHPRSKATTLGGDNFEAKKAGRIARGGKKRKGPPMKSRGFGKIHRPMRGKKTGERGGSIPRSS